MAASASPWAWDPDSKRYRNQETGRFLSADRVQKLRDGFLATQQDAPAALAAALAQGDLTLRQWEAGMRRAIKQTFLAEAMLGRGGRNAMTAKDWGNVGQQVRTQYGFLRGFAEDIAGGTLSEAQIASRAGLYVDAASQAYEKARAAAFDVDLPAHPGDGQTQCGARCACAWEYSEDAEAVSVTWALGEADHCPDCEANAEAWSPLVFSKDGGGEKAGPFLARANGKHRCLTSPS